jgi:hypothetical protein
MLRRTFISACGVAAAGAAVPALGRIQVPGPVTLTQAYIVFHVRDDDKDHDSYENITVEAGQWKVGSIQNAGAGTRWKDQTNIDPVYLQNIDNKLEPSDCDVIKVTIDHATQGNDNFKFAFTVTLVFSDGRSINYEQPGTATLTKNNGHGEWTLSTRK